MNEMQSCCLENQVDTHLGSFPVFPMFVWKGVAYIWQNCDYVGQGKLVSVFYDQF